MSENRIQYNELCPLCKAGGREEKLFLDMDKVEIRCEPGHVFEELPSDAALRTGTSNLLQSEQVPEVLGAVSEPVLGSISEQESGVADPEPEDTSANTLEDSVLAEEAREEAEERLAEIATKIAAATAPKVAERVPGTDEPIVPVKVNGAETFVTESCPLVLPNGDMLLCVRIPEQWKTAVEAEAEAQVKRPEEYMADWLTSEEMRTTVVDWLQSYWSSAYSQTV